MKINYTINYMNVIKLIYIKLNVKMLSTHYTRAHTHTHPHTFIKLMYMYNLSSYITYVLSILSGIPDRWMLKFQVKDVL